MNALERDARVLRHIVAYCEQTAMAVERFGDDFQLFDNDPVYRNAVALCILQIGELVGLLSENFRTTHDAIPWRQIKLMRNIVAHRYGTVDNTITWDVVQHDIPQLRAYCMTVLNAANQP